MNVIRTACQAIRSCTQCARTLGCSWAVIYQQGGRCVPETATVNAPVTGVVPYGGLCENPRCLDTIALWYIDWGVSGGIGIASGLVFGGLLIGAFIWCQRRWNQRHQEFNVPHEVDGFAPAFVRYARRNQIRRWLEEFLAERHNDEQHLELQQQVAQALGVGPADQANQILENMNQVQQQQPPPPPPQPQPHQQGGPNALLQAAQLDPNDQPAILFLEPPPDEPIMDPPEPQPNEFEMHEIVDLDALLGPNQGEPVNPPEEPQMRRLPARAAKTSAKNALKNYFKGG